MTTTRDVRVFPDLDQLSAAAAEVVSSAAEKAIAERGRFTVVLAGGSTPKKLYELLAQSPWRDRIDWSKTYFFMGDERLVPLDHPDSNYGLAYEALLSKVPVPEHNVFPVPTEVGRAADEDYQDEIIAFFKIGPRDWPDFDLVLLGIGSDGHTASLFPGGAALQDTRGLVIHTLAGFLPPRVERVTLSLPALNHGREVLFLAAGADKAPAVKAALHGGPFERADVAPAHLVQPEDGTLHWFIDEAAASQSDL